MVDPRFKRSHDELAQVADAAGMVAFLDGLVQDFQLRTLVYLVAGPVHRLAEEACALRLSDHGGKWHARSLDGAWPMLKSEMRRSFISVVPMNLAQSRGARDAVRQLLGDAFARRCGSQGVVFPIAGRLGEAAIFIVSGDDSSLCLNGMGYQMRQDFQSLACHVHQKLSEIRGAGPGYVHLSRREIECLRDMAKGYTMKEVAGMHALTERTVRYYLDSARFKLKATNISHAIAKAMDFGLIY